MRHVMKRAPKPMIASASVLALALVASGCHDDDDHYHDSSHRGAPLPPTGLISITGDRTVFLEWFENQETDLDGYRVYVAFDEDGPYDFIGFTHDADFTHRDLENGETVYYGVSAVDHAGNESELNREIVFDTPRPEGAGLVLIEADTDGGSGVGEASAYDFSRERRVRWDDDAADVYFDVVDGIHFLVVPDTATDIQDAGYLGFDDLTWAPAGGWAPSGAVEAIEGHVYVVWTRNDHYAKVRVIDVTAQDIEVDWAYQVDPGNQELRGSGRPTIPEPRPRLAAQALR